MINQNPYNSPADADRHRTDHNRDCDMTLAIVLVDVALSAYKAVRNVPAMLADPDTTPVGLGAAVVFWIVWIVIELVALYLVRRGRAVGKWLLVASLGLKGIAQIGAAASWLPLLLRTPSIALASPWLYYLVQAICYCGATCWLLFFASLPSRCAPQGSQLP